ncbi:SoxR reducing system RseC family protein [uncultured Cardiobacterium sp.]|uniref:SoxR reducing system RseC family protein n=1 Tax=uncultured Cardiobacterium sp. TaxID=417619 RepID=UPI0026212BD3|nr:SoxR reducing system RseC family protein [uncultured Cardiobacterium sp.]
MTDNTIRVRILAADAATVRLALVDDIRECKRCAEGNGCGGRPWFRGFRRGQPITLVNNGDWHSGDTAELHLTSAGLNLGAALTYGLPLLAFIATLALTRPWHEGWQILAATAAVLATPLVTRPLRHRIITRCLRLERARGSAARPCRYNQPHR